MKKINFAALLFLGIASVSAQIAPTGGTGNGDLFLGFQSSSNGNDVVYDLGNYTSFLNSGNTLNASSFSSFVTTITSGLTAVYGAGWQTNGTVTWGIIGGVSPALGADPNNTIYASKLSGTTAWKRNFNSAQGTIDSQVNTFISQYSTDLNNSQFTTGGALGRTNGGVVMNSSSESGLTWRAYDTYLGTSFGSFNGGISALTTQNLDLYKLTPNTVNTVAGTLLATLSLTAVPEPSSWALLTLAAVAGSILVYRKRLQS